jgi:hypothetical protein
VHTGNDLNSTHLKTSDFKSSSWTIADGHLTIGDFQGSPEATFAPERWFDVTKYEVDENGEEITD